MQHEVSAVIAEGIKKSTKNTVLRFKRAISVHIKADVADLLRGAIYQPEQRLRIFLHSIFSPSHLELAVGCSLRNRALASSLTA